jgi:hypothetical protein
MTSIVGPDNALPRFQKQSEPKVLNYFGVSDEVGQSRPGRMGCNRLAATIQFNRECTRIDANKRKRRHGGWMTPAGSPNGDRSGHGPKLRLDHPIRVHWRSFAVLTE